MSPEACIDLVFFSDEVRDSLFKVITVWCKEEVGRLHSGLELTHNEDRTEFVLAEKESKAIIRMDSLINMALFLGILR